MYLYIFHKLRIDYWVIQMIAYIVPKIILVRLKILWYSDLVKQFHMNYVF